MNDRNIPTFSVWRMIILSVLFIALGVLPSCSAPTGSIDCELHTDIASSNAGKIMLPCEGV